MGRCHGNDRALVAETKPGAQVPKMKLAAHVERFVPAIRKSAPPEPKRVGQGAQATGERRVRSSGEVFAEWLVE